MFYHRLREVGKFLAFALIFAAIILMETYCFSRIPPTIFEVNEDIDFYKARCDKIYPIASLEIEPFTNRLIITWKDGTISRRQ